MLAKNGGTSIGNMGEVYREFERISRAAEVTMADIDRRTGVIEAEIAAETTAAWYVVLPYAGCEPIAARHLIRRRFGIYQPMIEKERSSVRQPEIKRKEPMFPGYLFAYIWDIKTHYWRVRVCPGVAGFLMDRERPAVMPFGFISRMQVMECVSEGLGRTGKRFRKRYRNTPETIDPEALGGCEVLISTKSYWDGVDKLAAPERISLLHKALGLPS